MKQRIRDAAEILGFEGDNVNELFSEMEATLDRLDKITGLDE